VYGFGSIEQTLKKALTLDPTIKREDVKSFLDKQEVRQKKKPTKQNSFVPFEAHDEVQMDIAYFPDPPYRYGLVAIDVFSKMLTVIPLKTKDPGTVAKTINAVIEKIGYPTSIMVDSGSEFHREFVDELKRHEISLIVTRGSTIFAERAIRTIKEEIQKRKDALGAKSWVDVLPDVLQKYNSTLRVSTGMAPEEAQKYVNRNVVREHIEGRAKINRKYPSLKPGDWVKVAKKAGKYSEFKHDFNHWSEEVFEVSEVSDENGQNFYTLKGRSDRFLRHDLLKVEDVQRHPAALAAAKRGTFRQEELRNDLKPFIDRLKDALSTTPDRKMYTSEAAKVLRVIPGFTDLSKEFPSFVAILRMFPELEVATQFAGGTSVVKLREVAARSRAGSSAQAAGGVGPALLSFLPKARYKRLRTKSAWQDLHLIGE